MNTPICDFVKKYSESEAVRLHMPGHKGKSLLGFENLDITEFTGADSLYEADGIIAESEKNAGSLFGAKTFYSTEGASQCIRAMLYLAVCYYKKDGERPLILAGRNAHKAFISAAALLDFDIEWMYGRANSSYLSCKITSDELEKAIVKSHVKPSAVYITSPDYLGNTVDISLAAEVCHKYGVLLLVDNAHGAYLKFLKDGSRHPVDLGADLCCDSAHKTLPALTGAAYLHISRSADKFFSDNAKRALALFGSTSPSYLILQSLDAVNCYISEGYAEKLLQYCEKVKRLKERLILCGFELCGNEPLKITISTKSYGYEGIKLSEMLLQKNIVCEFSDRDYIVFMLTPENSDSDIEILEKALYDIPKKNVITDEFPIISKPESVMSVSNAIFAPSEKICASMAEGRILAAENVGCPPAVPIVVCGERIDANAVKCFEYYGIKECTVVKE